MPVELPVSCVVGKIVFCFCVALKAVITVSALRAAIKKMPTTIRAVKVLDSVWQKEPRSILYYLKSKICFKACCAALDHIVVFNFLRCAQPDTHPDRYGRCAA